jgi:hypothetical protein
MSSMTALEKKALKPVCEGISLLIDALGGVSQPNAFRSSEDQKEALLDAAKKGLDIFRQRIYQGVAYLIKEKIFERKNITEETIKQAAKELVENLSTATLQEKLGFSDDEMMHAYDHASKLYEEQLYTQAGNILLTLITLKPKVPSFWIGFGLTEEMSSLYPSAGISYLMALRNDPERLELALQSARCFFEVMENELAKEILHTAIEQAGSEPQFASIKEQAKRMLKEGV